MREAFGDLVLRQLDLKQRSPVRGLPQSNMSAVIGRFTNCAILPPANDFGKLGDDDARMAAT